MLTKVPINILKNVMIELTDFCNLSCPMCDQSNHGRNTNNVFVHNFQKKFMSFSLFKKIFIELERDFKCVDTVSYFWQGEPLLHPQFLDFFSFSLPFYKRGVLKSYAIHTNGLFLNEKIVNAILSIEVPASLLHFSIDAASPEVYAKIRCGGDFEKLLENIERFLFLKKKRGFVWPAVVLQFIVREDNFHQWKGFLAFWQEFFLKNGLKYGLVTDEHFTYYPQIIYFRRCGAGPEKQEFYNTLYQKVVLELTKMDFFSSQQDRINCNSPKKCDFTFFHKGCFSSFFNPVISSTGKVTLCCMDMKLEFSLGNIKRDSLFTLWNSKQALKIRRILYAKDWKDPFWQEKSMLKMCSNCQQLL